MVIKAAEIQLNTNLTIISFKLFLIPPVTRGDHIMVNITALRRRLRDPLAMRIKVVSTGSKQVNVRKDVAASELEKANIRPPMLHVSELQ